MSIGGLRRRLVLEERLRTPGTGGGALTAWVEVATVWARMTPLEVAERAGHERIAPRGRLRVRLRHRPEVTAARRFRDGTRVLDIVSVAAVDRRWLVWLCEAAA